MGWQPDGTFETETWRYIEAAHYGVKRTGPVRGEVWHTPEAPEGQDTAIGVARYFASGNTRGSTHTCVDGGTDGDNVIQCVYDSFVCHGAPGANHDFLHCEIAGYAGQSAAQWRDDYSLRAIEHAGDVTAQHALKYGFPIRRLTVDQLRQGYKGIVDHNAVRIAWRLTTHTDVGAHFPWDLALEATHRRHRHWLSTHPDFNAADDEPDFNVVVLASSDPGADVDEGMARVYAKRNRLKFLEWPFSSVTFGAAVVIGAAAKEADAIRDAAMADKVHVIAGANRDETAAKVTDELLRGERVVKLPY